MIISMFPRVLRCPIRRLFSGTRVTTLKLPSIMDATEGCVDKWYKEEGDVLESGVVLCDITLGNITVAFDVKTSGILAKTIVNPGQRVPVGSDIALIADSKDSYNEYLHNKRLAAIAAEQVKEAEAIINSDNQKPNTVVMLREIKHLINNGYLKESSDFTDDLLAEVRHGNERILEIFEASFEGTSFNPDSFDVNFFLKNAKDEIEEINKRKKEAKKKKEKKDKH